MHLPSFCWGREGWASCQIFQNGGQLGRISIFRGGCWERGERPFWGEVAVNKSEVFNNRKSSLSKMFFSVITKNLKWKILINRLVTFKRWDWVKDEKCWYYGGSLKNTISKGGRGGGGVHEKPIYRYIGGIT